MKTKSFSREDFSSYTSLSDGDDKNISPVRIVEDGVVSPRRMVPLETSPKNTQLVSTILMRQKMSTRGGFPCLTNRYRTSPQLPTLNAEIKRSTTLNQTTLV